MSSSEKEGDYRQKTGGYPPKLSRKGELPLARITYTPTRARQLFLFFHVHPSPQPDKRLISERLKVNMLRSLPPSPHESEASPSEEKRLKGKGLSPKSSPLTK